MMQAGFDGNAPVQLKSRDLDGEGKRELSVTRKLSRLEWLLAYKKITLPQFDAGHKLQALAEAAEANLHGSPEVFMPHTEGAYTGLSDGQCDAMTRRMKAQKELNSVMGLLGSEAHTFLSLVLFKGITTEKAASMIRRDRKAALWTLRDALDVVARHYRIG